MHGLLPLQLRRGSFGSSFYSDLGRPKENRLRQPHISGCTCKRCTFGMGTVPERTRWGHGGRGQTLSPLCCETCMCWWVCSRVCPLLPLWDKHSGWRAFFLLLLLLLPQPRAVGAMPAAAAGQEPSCCQVSIAFRVSRSTSTSG